MTNTITRYAIEIESHAGRNFVLTGFEMGNGRRYHGILFFESKPDATKSMRDDAQEDENEWITEILIHENGTITDAASGQDLTPGLAAQTSFSNEELMEMAAEYYRSEASL